MISTGARCPPHADGLGTVAHPGANCQRRLPAGVGGPSRPGR